MARGEPTPKFRRVAISLRSVKVRSGSPYTSTLKRNREQRRFYDTVKYGIDGSSSAPTPDQIRRDRKRPFEDSEEEESGEDDPDDPGEGSSRKQARYDPEAKDMDDSFESDDSLSYLDNVQMVQTEGDREIQLPSDDGNGDGAMEEGRTIYMLFTT